jgi:hypothetical protein
VLKVVIPAAAVLAVVWMVDIPKEWLPGKSERQIKAEQEKAAAGKAEAARRHAESVRVQRFDDPDGFFVASLAGKPEAGTVSANNVFNFMATAGRSYTRTLDHIHYVAKWERWHAVDKTERGRLDFMKPKLHRGPGLPAPRVKDVVTADGVKGIEAAGVYEDRPRKFKLKRVFQVPEQDGIDRYYSATVTGPADWLPSPEAEAFLSSFGLTEKAALFPLPGAPKR